MNGLFMVCSIGIMVSAYIILMQPIWNNANDTVYVGFKVTKIKFDHVQAKCQQKTPTMTAADQWPCGVRQVRRRLAVVRTQMFQFKQHGHGAKICLFF